MKTITRKELNAYCQDLARLNNVDNVTQKFTIEPSIEQKLEDRISESADFLKKINTVPVDELSGEILGLGVDGSIATRTDTNDRDRAPRAVGSFKSRKYQCEKTDFDTYITYQQLDTWAKFADFQQRLRKHVTDRIARDRLMIGWHGKTVEANTDVKAHPLLTDVNIGWLEYIRKDAPERVLSDIKVGKDGDYNNIDAAVYDTGEELLDPWHREDTDIVAIVGNSMVADKYLGLINAHEQPTEQKMLKTLLENKLMGNRRVLVVPFFPKKTILLTRPTNLSVYWQSGSHRRTMVDNAKRDRFEDYLSINEAYVVEDLGACALIEDIKTPDPDSAGGWK